MAVTAVPAFPQAPNTDYATATAACTTLNDSTNKVLLSTSGANGDIITSIGCLPMATITATQALLFLSKDGGTTYKFLGCLLIAAYTLATTTLVPANSFLHPGNQAAWNQDNPYELTATDRIYCAISVALATGVAFIATRRTF